MSYDKQSSHGNYVQPRRKPLAASIIVACSLSGAAAFAPVAAQQLEEVVVTATKRTESIQDVPMAVSVLNGQQLEELNITDMEDYVAMLPNVSYTSLGPGDGNVYIRGISSGGESTLGANPSVAVYLDEQPVTAVGSYMNPHIYDVQRIEVLAGPQGTLFGANAQSGALRIITNQPDPTAREFGVNFGALTPKSGDVGFTAEGFANIPLSDRAAIRLVGFVKEDPGFIDNVEGTHTFRRGYIRAGLTDPDLIALAQDVTIDNASLAEKNFNEAVTVGGRAALKVDLNDSWSVTGTVVHQDLEADGVWDHDPSVGDLQVTRFMPDSRDDKWTQLSLKVEGEIAGGTLTAAFGDMDRQIDFEADYSLYTDFYVSYGFVDPYYNCYVAYFGGCGDPRELLTVDSEWKRQTAELRYVSDPSKRFRYVAGFYYVDLDLDQDGEWHVMGLNDIPRAAVDAPDIYWTTDFERTFEETAFFGELSYDITEQLTLSASARTFEFDSQLIGFSGTVWWPCGGWGPQGDRPPNNYGENCAPGDRKTSGSDEVYRVNLEFNPNDDWLLYATWGQGYRPGGLNRFCETRESEVQSGLGDQGAAPASCAFESDFLEAIEFGFKATLLDGRMRLNAAAFWQDWEDFQFSRLDTSISPITLTFNVGNAESNGFEADMQYLITENWSISSAISFLDAELTQDYDRNPSAMDGIEAASGTPLPRVPEEKFNISTRYEWDSGYYLQGTFLHTGDSFNDLFDGGTVQNARALQDDYQVLNAAVGLRRDNWTAEFFVRNLTDERGDVFINANTWDSRIGINRPRTFGLTFGYLFQ